MNDTAFDAKRLKMVDEQLIARGISDKKVLSVFKKVPRHRFVPEKVMDSAYSDFPLSIGSEQTISQPYMVALMTELLELSKDDKVLEIGTGSGYQTAILSELAKEVYSVERVRSLADRSALILAELGYKNVKIKTDDGTLGWDEYATYDGIMVTAGSPDVPASLTDQLAEGGRMVIPIGGSFSQMLIVLRKVKGKIQRRDVCGCVFVPLIGKQGWEKGAS